MCAPTSRTHASSRERSPPWDWACTGSCGSGIPGTGTFSTTSTSLQSITTPGTIPSRDANGAALGPGVELWLEVYSAPGATGANWTVTYTDESNNSGATSVYAHPANAESVGQAIPMTLAAGDVGVRAVASLQCSISSGTAGDVGITLRRRVAQIPLTVANIGTVLDFATLGLPELFTDSCLEMIVQCSTTSTGFILPGIVVAQG